MKYFAKVTQAYWVTKNKLEEDVRSMVFSMDRRMLADDQEKKQYLARLRANIDELNARHKRCKPLIAQSFPDHLDQGDTCISVGNVFVLVIYKKNGGEANKNE